MKPNIGITDKKLNAVTEILSIVLADQVTLYTKTRKFHWNVCGESFMELHKLFENQYTQLEASIDEVAERISKLGSKTIGTMNNFCASYIVSNNNRRSIIFISNTQYQITDFL